MSKKIILDLCGGTGSWSQPYKDAGYDVRLFTLPLHDVRTIQLHDLPDNIHGVLCAPPCTHFSVSGAQYWAEKDKDGRTQADLDIVDACLAIVKHTKPVFWCLENPVGRLIKLRNDGTIMAGGPRLRFNPCDYGGWLTPSEYTNPLAPQDAYTKKTLLWGRFNLPERKPVTPIFKTAANGDKYSPIHMATGGKSAKTKEIRSKTPKGFAKAFFEANQ